MFDTPSKPKESGQRGLQTLGARAVMPLGGDDAGRRNMSGWPVSLEAVDSAPVPGRDLRPDAGVAGGPGNGAVSNMTQVISETLLRDWMQRLGPRLINLSAGICRDQHRAEEIVQEAFIKLWRQPPEAGEVAFSSWLRRVVTNLSINALKRNKRPGPLPEFSNDPALHATHREYEQIDSEDTVARIRTAMDRLDDSKRSILVLRAYEHLSYEEIAEHLNVPVGTVMSRLNRARAALKDELDSIEKEAAAATSKPQEQPVIYRFKQA